MAERLVTGERARLTADIDNLLTPGRYKMGFWVCRNRNFNDIILRVPRVLDFVVYGSVWSVGVVSLEAEIEAAPERGSAT